MKPLTLQISGLNSFRQSTTIPFNELLKDGLFGIFGPTGSGKSTILDAITLALYGKVRRAPGGTGGIINMAERICHVGFSFSTGIEANLRRYTVERRLARNRAGGVETRSVRLLCEERGEMIPKAEKIGEVREMIQDIVGINHDDFQRAVVLPQGAFAEFLSLETRARGAVLERLFGLQDLGFRLNTLLKERSEAFERKRTEVEARLLELRGYDDDALASAEAGVAETATAVEQARARRDRASADFEQASALLALIAEQAMLHDRSGTRRLEAERLAEMQERIHLAERSALVNSHITMFVAARARYTEAEARYAETRDVKDRAEKELDRLLPLFRNAEERYTARHEPLGEQLLRLEALNQAKGALQLQQTRLETLSATAAAKHAAVKEAEERRSRHANDVAVLEEELAGIERRLVENAVSADARAAAAELELAIERHHTATRELRKVEGEVAATAADMERVRAGMTAAAERKSACEGESLAARAALLHAREAAHAARGEVDALLEQHGVIRNVLAEIRVPEQEIAAYEGEAAALDVRHAAARHGVAAAAKQLEAARDVFAAASRLHAEAAAAREQLRRTFSLTMLGADLHEGEACPLCGSREHPHPHRQDPEAAVRLQASDADVVHAQERLAACEADLRGCERAADTAQREMEDVARDRERLRARREAAELAITAALAALRLEPRVDGVDDLRGRLQTILEKGTAAREQLQRREREVVVAEENVQHAEAARTEAAQAAARHAAEESMVAARGSALERELADRRRGLDEVHAVIAPHAAGRTMDRIEADLRLLRDRDRTTAEIERRRDDARIRLRERMEERERIEADLRLLRNAGDSAGAEERLLREEVERMMLDLKNRWEEVVPPLERESGIAVDDAIAVRQQERESLRSEHEAARRKYEESRSSLAAARHRLEDCWNDLCREEKARDEADRDCAAALAAAGFSDPGDAEQHALEAGALRALRREASELDAALESERRRMESLEAEIGGRSAESAALEHYRNELSEASRFFDEAQQRYGAAQETLRVCREKNVEWKAVRGEDILSLEGKVTADQLVKYLRGNGFIEYLANERLAEVCRRASLQLSILTGGRFEVLARPKEGFIIRDHANDGGERAPASLSGGETFLVSLSLALALSDTVQTGHAPLEFFFLDEGFGTLDNDLLETVMNSLERIRSEHRAIGVISHVSQLRERIARRLIVSPASDTVGTRVRFELA
ncbi:MAG TPA: SMC family ATPase [Candidatus Kapabacteria bacterium]|nr:SMC family ATPase [Candidatus Kapabacteria bacterium]